MYGEHYDGPERYDPPDPDDLELPEVPDPNFDWDEDEFWDDVDDYVPVYPDEEDWF